MNPSKQLEACGQAPWLDYPQEIAAGSADAALR
jgi:hypothetical protein